MMRRPRCPGPYFQAAWAVSPAPKPLLFTPARATPQHQGQSMTVRSAPQMKQMKMQWFTGTASRVQQHSRHQTGHTCLCTPRACCMSFLSGPGLPGCRCACSTVSASRLSRLLRSAGCSAAVLMERQILPNSFLQPGQDNLRPRAQMKLFGHSSYI